MDARIRLRSQGWIPRRAAALPGVPDAFSVWCGGVLAVTNCLRHPTIPGFPYPIAMRPTVEEARWIEVLGGCGPAVARLLVPVYAYDCWAKAWAYPRPADAALYLKDKGGCMLTLASSASNSAGLDKKQRWIQGAARPWRVSYAMRASRSPPGTRSSLHNDALPVWLSALPPSFLGRRPHNPTGLVSRGTYRILTACHSGGATRLSAVEDVVGSGKSVLGLVLITPDTPTTCGDFGACLIPAALTYR
ncbi:hypothetical protein R3P38DRAFT_3193595 [Favolaschia claudopus]|uniref:Uncharacterized protein n=1 Tax=Favolaschia claudopus TaxID=2862362 RepID=A0AAW0BH37_9AGAR